MQKRKGARVAQVAKRFDGWAAACAVAVAACAVAGFAADDALVRSEPVMRDGAGAAAVAAVALVAAAVLYVAVAALFRAVDRIRAARPASMAPAPARLTGAPAPAPAPAPARVHRRRFLAAWLVILACWLPVFILRFPGNGDSDTDVQLLQFFGLYAQSDHHPWFDTLVFGAFWQLGDALGGNWWSLGLFSGLQSLLTAASLAASACYARWLGAPRGLAWGAVAFVGVMPIYPAFAQTMCKDTMFAWMWVAYLLLYVEAARTRGELLRRPAAVAGLLASGLLCALAKKTGIYLVVLSGLVLLAWCRRARLAQVGVLAATVLLYSGLWCGVLLPAWGVANQDGMREMMSVPAQVTAQAVRERGGAFSARDWAVLEAVYDDPQTLGAVYEPFRADAAKGRLRLDASRDDLLAYLGWLAGQAASHPAGAGAAVVANALPLFELAPSVEGYENLPLLYLGNNLGTAPLGRVVQEQRWADWSGGMATVEQVHDVLDGGYRTPGQAAAVAAADEAYLAIARALFPLFNKVVYATWLPLLVLAYAARTRRGWAVVACVPGALMWATLLVGPVVLVRYLAPVMDALVLCLALLFDGPSGDAGRDVRARGPFADDGGSVREIERNFSRIPHHAAGASAAIRRACQAHRDELSWACTRERGCAWSNRASSR